MIVWADQALPPSKKVNVERWRDKLRAEPIWSICHPRIGAKCPLAKWRIGASECGVQMAISTAQTLEKWNKVACLFEIMASQWESWHLVTKKYCQHMNAAVSQRILIMLRWNILWTNWTVRWVVVLLKNGRSPLRCTGYCHRGENGVRKPLAIGEGLQPVAAGRSRKLGK